MCFKLLPKKKHILKTKNQLKFNYGLSPDLLRIVVACDVSANLFKLKGGILLPLTK